MKSRFLLPCLGGLLGLIGNNYFAHAAPEVYFYGVEVNQNEIFAKVGLRGAIQAPSEFWTVFGSDQRLPTKFESKPVRLWVLADVASQCAPRKVGSYLHQLGLQLKKYFHPDALVSAGAFATDYQSILFSDQRISENKDLNIQCQSNRMSSDASSLLISMAEKQMTTMLPTFVWILTSGNASLSPEALEWVKKLDLKVQILVYNPIIFDQVQSIAEQHYSGLGRERIRLVPLETDLDAAMIPEIFYSLHIQTLPVLANTTQIIKIVAHLNERAISEGRTEVSFPKAPRFYWLQGRVLRIIVGSVLFFVVCLGVGIWQIYRPRFCRKCQKSTRRRDTFCLFCYNSGEAVLIGKRLDRDLGGVQNGDVILPLIVLPFIGGKIEIGTHRKSPCTIMKKVGEIPSPWFQIRCTNNGRSYKLSRLLPQSPHQSSISTFTINNELVHDFRLLGNGDQIRIRNYEFTFYYWEPSHE